ncbi:MAG TPA: glycoside hydrolase family 3 C-terminal domain-containing protein [Pilimelia sp.]|nr:glycoside hydrolase family 3 C-terminal domain-containing protein [Pilimelia sp.]
MTDGNAVIEAALAELDLATKVRLLSGQDMWTLPAVPAIGLASLVMSDGPIGIRGTAWAPDERSVALPSPTALAATWDPDLARAAGRLLGGQARARGIHILLAPTVNLHRTPLGGRHFECYSEDPLLTGEIGAAYATGLQEQGVGATVKHLVANDSETDRLTVDVRVGERALRELYLAPFERIVAAGVWVVMAAYNSVNGTTMTEHGPLQNDLLKGEWGFDGAVVSDWTAARSTAPAALGGLDVVMPALGDPWGDRLIDAVRAGEVPVEVVDDKVRRVLRLAGRVGAWDRVAPAVAPADRPPTPAAAAVAREVAVRSFVLARNAGGLLPLDPAALRRVAVSGALAADARVQGGGSAQVVPEQVVSPLAGLAAALPGVRLDYAVGADPRRTLPPAAAGAEWGAGFTATLRDAAGGELFRTTLDAAVVRGMGGLPGVDPAALASVELVGTLTPTRAGPHRLAINGFGEFRLTVGGRVLFDDAAFPPGVDPAMVLLHPVELRFEVDLAAGEPVAVRLTQRITSLDLASFVSATLGHAGPTPGPDELIEAAVRSAAAADVAVVVVGTTEEVESEGFDRTSLALPGRQDELVARVAAANPRTVVVVNAGAPVLLPWAGEVAAILLTWFPGQQAGAALADVLLGVAEPGGRLPTTWPRREQDCPVLATTPTDNGVLAYDEGVFIGYRGWDRAGTVPLFPFGHGLGYTTWAYESLTVPDPATAVVTLRNTGSRAGREVVQVYAGPVAADPDRPVRVLAGFATVAADPGGVVTVSVPLTARYAQVWAGGWRTIAGAYRVTAGPLHATTALG